MGSGSWSHGRYDPAGVNSDPPGRRLVQGKWGRGMRISTRGPEAGQSPAGAGRRRFWLRLAAILGALVLALLGGLVWLAANADRIADAVVESIPGEQELALGELVLAEARLRARLDDTGPAADALRAIGDRLTAGSRSRYRWFVAARSEPDAAALPGGIVIVSAGLIALAATPEELAGVLAHEVAHAERRHALRAGVQRLGVAGLLRLFLVGASEPLGHALAAAAAAGFSREAEAEADRDAVGRLVGAGIDPLGLPAMLATLSGRAPAAGPSWLASHPPLAARIAALRAEIGRRSPAAPPSPLAVDWAAVQAAVQR